MDEFRRGSKGPWDEKDLDGDITEIQENFNKNFRKSFSF
jgi:hypothetical protein